MTTHLQHLLQSLCWKTEWNYAVFWKLERRDQMVLTWEDGYYNNQNEADQSESKNVNETLDGLQNGHVTHDSLALAVAKMSYYVYSLGEGIVGRVAVTGEHQWIFASEQDMTSYSTLNPCDDAWQAQFAAGIKTIVVAAVFPHGVIQFGSLNAVKENVRFLAHIRDVFCANQESVCQTETPMQSSLQHMLQMSEDISSGILNPDLFQDYLVDKAANKEHIFPDSAEIPTLQKHLDYSGILISGVDTNYSNSSMIQNEGPNRQISYSSQSYITENSSLYNGKQKVDDNMEILPEIDSCLETSGNFTPSFMFSAGTELHEALGTEFLKQCYPFPSEVENLKDGPTSKMPEATESSIITSNSGKDHLLEAVVENFCCRDALMKSKSSSTFDSMLTTERMPKASINTTSHTVGSSCYSMARSSLIQESMQNCLNSSGSYSNRSLVEPSKPNKKRARPGENSRPRPRDRQLIQDRIKDLRELVPNGSKCSIDSLLEQTIKHMIFMQNVTKHSDKLSNSAKSKACSEMGGLGSGYDQGSCWAVEVGGDMKICPILVENLNTNGQMLIEMFCDDCDNFMEITEVIRSLGLTILKGITDSHGDKTCMRFVVEGQSNLNLHRMDVMWSLVQILQSKATL